MKLNRCTVFGGRPENIPEYFCKICECVDCQKEIEDYEREKAARQEAERLKGAKKNTYGQW